MVNIDAANMGAAHDTHAGIPRLKEDFETSTVIRGDLGSSLTAMGRSSKPTIHKETRGLKDTLHQLDVPDIVRPLHPKATDYTFFSRAHGTFSRGKHILAHTSGLSQDPKNGMQPCLLLDHNALKLGFPPKRRFGANWNTWKLKRIQQRRIGLARKGKTCKNSWKPGTPGCLSPFSTGQKSSNSQVMKNKGCRGGRERTTHPTLWVGTQADTATLENSTEVPQELKHSPSLWARGRRFPKRDN